VVLLFGGSSVTRDAGDNPMTGVLWLLAIDATGGSLVALFMGRKGDEARKLWTVVML
jgi:hypothetical protein